MIYVIDASVALKWFVDEGDQNLALELTKYETQLLVPEPFPSGAISELNCSMETAIPPKIPQQELEELKKRELHILCDRLLSCETAAVEECVAFLEAESFGVWHGRARAMMARRLKHCRLFDAQRDRVVDAILDRLASGRFSEQFKDQLRLVLHIAPARAFKTARKCEAAPAEHVRRYARWILSHRTSAA